MLADNDAYHALEAVGGLIKTGPTGTNVNDVSIGLVEKAAQHRSAAARHSSRTLPIIWVCTLSSALGVSFDVSIGLVEKA